MKENIKNKEINSLNKKETQNKEVVKETQETTIENLEFGIQEIEKIENNIENEADNYLSKEKNDITPNKIEELLSHLQTESTNFIKNVSRKLSERSKEAVNSFRDERIKNKSRNLYKRLGSNKAINNYKEKVKNTNEEDAITIKEDKRLANIAFDTILKSSKDFLTTIKSDNWGHSKKEIETFEEVSYLLEQLIQTSASLEREEEIFKSIEILSKLTRSSCKGPTSQYIFSGLERAKNYLFTKKTTNSETGKQENINEENISKEIFNNEPLLMFSYLSSNYYYNKKKLAPILHKEVDNLIEKYPNIKHFPFEDLLKKDLENYPRDYLNDTSKKSYVFDIYKKNLLEQSYRSVEQFRYTFYFFDKELKNLPQEEANKIYEIIKENLNHYDESIVKLMLDSLPVHKNENEKGVDYLLESTFSKDFNQEEQFLLLTQLLKNKDSLPETLTPEEIEKNIFMLVEKLFKNYPEYFYKLDAFFENYNLSNSCKEKLAELYMSNVSFDTLKNLFKEDETSPRVLSVEEKWLKTRPDLMVKLEAEFYKKHDQIGSTDFRHLFYEVIEDKKETSNKEQLIISYAENIYSMEPEEFIDLFIIRKKLDPSFAKLFLPKIRNADSFFNQIEDGLRLNTITKEERDWVIEEFIKNGTERQSRNYLLNYLNEIKENTEKKNEVLEGYIKNISGQIESYTGMKYFLETFENENISNEEKVVLFKKSFEEMLLHEKNHKYIAESINNAEFLDDLFTKEELHNILQKIISSNNQEAVISLLSSYLSPNTNLKDGSHPILSLLDTRDRETLFSRSLEFNQIRMYNHCLLAFEELSQNEQDLLIKKLVVEDPIANNTGSFQVNLLLGLLIEKAEKQDSSLSQNIETIFSKIFSSPKLSGESLSSLNNEGNRTFLKKHPKIFEEFIDQYIHRIDASPLEALAVFNTNLEPKLSNKQIQELSKSVLEKRQINTEIYNMYLKNTKESTKFFLDQELFNENISMFIEHNNRINREELIEFFILQRQNKMADKITCNLEQEKMIYKKIINNEYEHNHNNTLEKIISLDSKLFYDSLDDLINEENLSETNIRALSKDESPDIDPKYSKKIVQYIFKREYTNSCFVPLVNKYKDNPELLTELKDAVNKTEHKRDKRTMNLYLLQQDLFNAEELKEIYNQTQQEESVREKVLSSAEILGSLASMESKENTTSFFAEENENTKQNMEKIISFVNKYPIENKGRTIVVMLFAKHYMPDKKIEEIVETVTQKLTKYEKVLEKFNYEDVPEGLRSSIGMEYEITSSTATGYKELTDGDLKTDIARLSAAAHIGSGRDAVHEIATKPTTNPYLMLLEMQLLNDVEYIDFNFERSPSYQKGARGYHMTIGGETGVEVNSNTHFLQNILLAASWGGIHAGETGKRVSGGRGVTLRGRSAHDTNNIKIFNENTNSVELRSLSIDKFEPLQRSVTTAFNGAIAIQALEKYTTITSDRLIKFIKQTEPKNEEDFIKALTESRYMKEEIVDPKIKKIIFYWAKLIKEVEETIEYHNTEFLSGETSGYLDNREIWVDTADFGGQYNQKRFESVVESIDPTLSVEEYVNSTKININNMFSSFNEEMANTLTKINNLYLKPTSKVELVNEETKKKTTLLGGGDQSNSIAFLRTTKLNNETIERRDEPAYLEGTVFETLGERREGYYYIQGASEKMLTHGIQKALLSFNKQIEELVNKN